MIHPPAVIVAVEVIASVSWLISIDRRIPGRLLFRVGSAWNDPANRPAFIAAGRKLMTEDERRVTRSAYGLPPEPMDEPEVVAGALPADTSGTWQT